ncbi:unnamed protein product [Paramecium sonneborni]|uniref:Uncharacterized protein n=1 Tax=Paramecium sonneborni TaxID=65129 RepID=A0A8S1R809_9CILI|nr:unnamed protein product [Paramecium sonneborni]
MNSRTPQNNVFAIQKSLKKSNNHYPQDQREFLGQFLGDHDIQKEFKKVDYHNPKDLSWNQF